MWEGSEPPPSRAGWAAERPAPSARGRGRAALPSAPSAASRRPHLLPHPGREREPLPPSRAGGLRALARARLHLHPSGLTASRLGPHRSSSSFGGLSAFLPASTPPTPARAEVGGASRAARSHGPARSPAPARAPGPAWPAARETTLPPRRPSRGPARRFGAHAPRRRRRGRARPRALAQPPLLGGASVFQLGSGAGWLGGSGEKNICSRAEQAPSWALRPLALRRWRAPR
jgi:hypothetical protein